MKEVPVFSTVLFMLFGVVRWVQMVQSVETDLEASLERVEDLKFLKKVSDNRINENKNVNTELKKFFSEDHTLCQSSISKYENLVKTTDNYIQRYISLFLITSNLLNHEVKDTTKMVTVDLELSLSGEDLAYLQGYAKNIKGSSYPKNFSKLDAIFTKIARLKERSFIENSVKSSKSFLASLNIFSVFNYSDYYHFLPLLVIFFISKTFYYVIQHKSFYIIFSIFINSMIFWESLQLYWKKIKEADIEIYVKTLQSKGEPEDCNPANIKWYHSLLNLFLENKCLQYYKIINKNPIEEVSLFKCIIDTYSFYLIQTPFRILGASIRDFTGEISALWPWPFQYFVNIPIANFITVLVCFVALILWGKRLRLSFFGSAIEIGDVKVTAEKEKFQITNCESPANVRIVKRLKLWTKTKFPKRLNVDLERRRKLHLKASKSKPDVTEENQLNFSCSNTSFSDSKINHEGF